MVMYRHVASEADRLDDVVDVVFGAIGLPPRGVKYAPTLNEQSLPLDGSTSVAGLGTGALGGLPMAAYPHLAEFIREHARRPGYSYGNEFEFGLDLILDGLGRVRDAL